MPKNNRKGNAKVARKTVKIINRGGYKFGVDDTWVDLSPELEFCIENTVEYPPGRPLPRIHQAEKESRIEVHQETTLSAISRLNQQGLQPVALNFASAYNPGGGFLKGASAQEETLVRASGLYACLKSAGMYRYHAQRRDPMYTDYAIYSPEVPIFRDEEGALLQEPYTCAFVTSPAPNAGAVLRRNPKRKRGIRRQLVLRIRKVLTLMAAHGHQHIILGAWGCGVFRNDPEQVAEIFASILHSTFQNVFELVVFAILDRSRTGRFITPFQEQLSDSITF